MEAIKNLHTPAADLKSQMNEAELAYFEALILRKRNEAQAELDYLTNSLKEMQSSDDDDASSIDHHMGDMGSIAENMDLNYRLIERNRVFIRQLDRALNRIENGTYGICRATGLPIEKGRLEFAPHTRYSVEAKKQGLDKMRVPVRA